MPNTITDTITELADNKSDIQDALVAKGVTSAGKHGFNKFAEDIASITNQYTPSDEGKVVSNGELVAQTAYPSTITENGTYNTTKNNSVTVNVGSTSTSACAELYDTNTYETKVRLCLSITNNAAILAGAHSVGTTEKNYYINPNELLLSDFFNENEKIITGLGRGESSSIGIYTIQCTLHIAQNYISIKTTASVSGTPTFYLYLDTQ